MTKTLISIVGPTAIGKTALSIQLAQYYNTEIISADSRQFYKEMQIGTAAPTPLELASAPHHFIQHKSIEEPYNVGDFEKDAIHKLTQIHGKNDIAIMVGGSGLFVKSVTEGLDKLPKVKPEVRTELNKKFELNGLDPLVGQLKILDDKSYHAIALDNPQRVIRALEVCLSSGQPYSSFLTSKAKQRNFKTLTIGLTAERHIIYERINKRVDLMIANGLIDEVKVLISKRHLNVLNTIGYKELFNYFEGDWNLEFAVSEIKKNSRRFAKRQLTWFKKNENTLWFNYNTDTEEIINVISKKISS
ncbi:tRNA (adenosine(37)-N6)-dimethylallyltransferase MiaA [uncultured Psychroserpens sp.]|uniref:tRNA (adenosine(37)-N6)-dimethylallyltransferase MiaA n=1 Tax=uncultured Psychroserpens sp. TaxID=255436 RepID=UPI00263666D8|nr:tRNA (adenosine(37)-N6)-dimethylallyltransferase MiaA [uncultured Psychroserpens sp.]